MFQIQQSNVKANDAVKNLNAVAKATLKDSLRNVESLTLVSAASPDGGVKLNDKLAAAREKNTVRYMKNRNQAAIDAKYIAQDWEGGGDETAAADDRDAGHHDADDHNTCLLQLLGVRAPEAGFIQKQIQLRKGKRNIR